MQDSQLSTQIEGEKKPLEIPFLYPFPPLPLPLPVPLNLPKKQIKFTISERGDLDFDGDLNQEAYLLIESAIAASKNKTKLEYEVKLKEVNLTKEVDAIIIVFASCVLSMAVFFSYSLVSMISAQFHRHASIEQNVKPS